MKTIITLSASIPSVGSYSMSNNIKNDVQVKYRIIQDRNVNYDEITIADIPDTIRRTLHRYFPGYSAYMALRGDDSTYKIAVIKDKKREVIILNYMGELLKIGDLIKTKVPAYKR